MFVEQSLASAGSAKNRTSSATIAPPTGEDYTDDYDSDEDDSDYDDSKEDTSAEFERKLNDPEYTMTG